MNKKKLQVKELREDTVVKSPDAEKFLKEAGNVKKRYYIVPLVVE